MASAQDGVCHGSSGSRTVWRFDSESYAEKSATPATGSGRRSYTRLYGCIFGSRSVFAMWKICWWSLESWSRTRPFGARSIISGQ